MKQKIFSLVLLALCVVAASAGVKNATTLCIENLKGEVVQFPLTESPKMTFKGNFIVVQASATKVIRFKDVRQVYFTDRATGINDATAGEEIDHHHPEQVCGKHSCKGLYYQWYDCKASND